MCSALNRVSIIFTLANYGKRMCRMKDDNKSAAFPKMDRYHLISKACNSKIQQQPIKPTSSKFSSMHHQLLFSKLSKPSARRMSSVMISCHLLIPIFNWSLLAPGRHDNSFQRHRHWGEGLDLGSHKKGCACVRNISLHCLEPACLRKPEMKLQWSIATVIDCQPRAKYSSSLSAGSLIQGRLINLRGPIGIERNRFSGDTF